MNGRVEGKVAFVTGAARGIGKACAVRLAEEGADVAVLDIARPVESVLYDAASPDQLEESAAEIRALGRRSIALRGDVRSGADMAGAADAVVREFGRIDILVAAAGIDSWAQAWEITDEQWDALLDVDLKGVWQAAKAVAPHMIERKSGSMVFIGSALSHRANKLFAHYTAAKHGVLGLTRAFGIELAPHTIRVNQVDPTAVPTAMITSQAYKDGSMGRKGVTDEEMRARYLQWNALPFPWVETVDVANAVLFLASDEARYVTGVALPVDLGALLR